MRGNSVTYLFAIVVTLRNYRTYNNEIRHLFMNFTVISSEYFKL